MFDNPIGGPAPHNITDKVIIHATNIALNALKVETAACNTSVTDIEVLSAMTEVVDGLLVILHAKIFANGAEPNFTYHDLRVLEEINAHGGKMMSWHLEGLTDEGMDIGWCEIMTTCTGDKCEDASL